MIAARRRQRGIALLVVLWACTLLAVLLGGYAMLARTEGMQARYQFAQAQAHYAAEAGLARAIVGLQAQQPAQRWIADGRAYDFRFDNAQLHVSAIDENGKVDLNAGSPQVLQGLFRAAGLREDEAQRLARAVVDWRSFVPLGASAPTDGLYAGRDYAPRHAPFASLEELQQVAGMTPALYVRVAPVITLWSGRESPDQGSAPPLALAAIPGMTPEQAAEIAAARTKPQPTGLVAGGGVTHSIRSEAMLADGTRAVLRATIRLQGARSGAQPYAVLHWQEGEEE
ncbi:general secretion pathway protein GspK [Frateuria defendens]|uniref:general secretion pathway protein GspK n=1 Tax=Frateuria defendens TaxID=2219559 RepID=UPI00066FC5F4|nr:type II secretion system protein GspK [Frateuria defendens]